nr:MAG TPA: hypothetical protein [Caudoviricetes sp.]
MRRLFNCIKQYLNVVIITFEYCFKRVVCFFFY